MDTDIDEYEYSNEYLDLLKKFIEKQNFPIIVKVNNSNNSNDYKTIIENSCVNNFFIKNVNNFKYQDSESIIRDESNNIQCFTQKGTHKNFKIYWELNEDFYSNTSFIATFSHEIRTPLNGIIGIASLLSETKLNEEQKDFLELIKESSLTLLSIVNDILDYTNMENNKIKLDLKPFKISELIERCQYIMLPKATLKGISLDYEINHNIPPIFIGDSNRISQIIINLLSNAIKFTKKGHVNTFVYYDSNEQELVFSVKDTGIGIEKNYQSKLFKKTSSINPTRNEYSGTGLGLIICKKLTDLMGGKVYLIHSEPLKGSEFGFRIPIEISDKIEKSESREKVLEKIKDLKVLIVDDNENNRLTLFHLVKKWGMEPIILSSAREALAMVNHYKFSLGLIDIVLDKSNGIELAKKLKKLENNFPLIALSSLGDHNINYEKSFEFFLVKPVREEKLFNSIKSIFVDDVLPLTETIKKIKTNEKKILLAEDEKIIQIMMKGYFDSMGQKNYLIVGDGLEVLEALKKDYYDIIFLDIKMPFGGIETFKEIKKMYKDKRPVCIALTALEIQDVGFDEYIIKPVLKKDFQKILEKYL